MQQLPVQEVKECASNLPQQSCTSFSSIYHSLIHSSASETLLNLEHTYALTMENLISKRDADISHITEKFVFSLVLISIFLLIHYMMLECIDASMMMAIY